MNSAKLLSGKQVIAGLWGIVRRYTVFTLLISHGLLRKLFEATDAKNTYEIYFTFAVLQVSSCKIKIRIPANILISYKACFNPDYDSGICIPLSQCPKLGGMVRNQENIDFLRQSQCGFMNKEPLVCCVVPSEPTLVEWKNPWVSRTPKVLEAATEPTTFTTEQTTSTTSKPTTSTTSEPTTSTTERTTSTTEPMTSSSTTEMCSMLTGSKQPSLLKLFLTKPFYRHMLHRNRRRYVSFCTLIEKL